MRGRIACSHCAAEVPHGADHSSPASFQSYSITLLAFARDQARSSLKLKMWLGPELNRRHADFQSAALPTELPSRNVIVDLARALTMQHPRARTRGRNHNLLPGGAWVFCRRR